MNGLSGIGTSLSVIMTHNGLRLCCGAVRPQPRSPKAEDRARRPPRKRPVGSKRLLDGSWRAGTASPHMQDRKRAAPGIRGRPAYHCEAKRLVECHSALVLLIGVDSESATPGERLGVRDEEFPSTLPVVGRIDEERFNGAGRVT